MNVVLDTNVLISGYLFGGKPGLVTRAALSGKVCVHSSNAILGEFVRIARDKFHIGSEETDATKHIFEQVFSMVRPQIIPDVLADTPDNHVLAIVHEAKIDAIVTGDKAMLKLKKYRGAKIMTVNQFLAEYEVDIEEI